MAEFDEAFADLLPKDSGKDFSADFKDLLPKDSGRDFAADFADLKPAGPTYEGDSANLDARDLQARRNPAAKTGFEAVEQPAATDTANLDARDLVARRDAPDVMGFGSPPVEPRAPYTGEGGVLTNSPAGMVAGLKGAGANFVAGLAEEYAKNVSKDIESGRESAPPIAGAAGRFFGSPARGPELTPERQSRLIAQIVEADKVGTQFKQAAAQAQKEAELVTPRNMDVTQQAIWSFVQSAPPTMLGISIGILTRNPWLAASVAGGGGAAQQTGSTYGEAMEKLQKAGVSPEDAHRIAWNAATIDGILEGVGETIPLSTALKPGTKYAKRMAGTIWQESGQEGLTQLGQDLNAYLSYNPEITLQDALKNLQVAMLAGGMGGAVYGTAGHLAQAPQMTEKEQRAKVVADQLNAAVQGEFTVTPEEVAAHMTGSSAPRLEPVAETPQGTESVQPAGAAPQQTFTAQPAEVRQPIVATPTLDEAQPQGVAAPSATPQAEVVQGQPAPPAEAPEEPLEAYSTKAKAEAEVARLREEEGGKFKVIPHPTEEGQFAIQPVVSSDAQLAAAAATSRRRISESGINTSRDSITTAIAKMGGLPISEASELSQEGATRAPNSPMRFLIRRSGGVPIDIMAQHMAAEGYLSSDGDVNGLREKIMDELYGRRNHWSVEGAEDVYTEQSKRRAALEGDAVQFADDAGIQDLEANVPAEDWASLHEFVPATESALTGPKMAVAELMQKLTALDEAAAERIAMQSDGKTYEEIAKELDDAINTREQNVGDRGLRVGEASQPFALTQETEAERQAREAGDRSRADRERQEAEQRDNRDRADRERGDFTLTGSERPADVAAAQGQQGLKFYNLRYSKQVQRTTESESKPRMNVAAELKRLLRVFDNGIISGNPQTGNQLANEVEQLIQKIKDHREPRFRERVRGSEWVYERLLRARRLGELNEETVNLALWMLDQNPNLAGGLGISIRTNVGNNASGNYNPLAQIISLSKESDKADTAAHEILHHTERMMPDEIREGIIGEWLRQMSAAYRNATPENREIMRQVVGAAAGEPTAKKLLAKLMESGKFPYELYQYTNPSEFWAVNGARILTGRYEAGQKGWVAKARQWLKEFIEKLKSIVGLASDAPVIRALNDVLENAEGVVTRKDMLANESQFMSPDGRTYVTGNNVNPAERPTQQGGADYVAAASRELRSRRGQPNTWESDAGLLKRMMVTPRTIAAFEPQFTPVYQTAVEQWKFRDQLIAKFEREAEPYFKASREDQGVVNKILEHDRLTGQIALAGQNTTVHFTSPQAELSRPGDRLTVTDDQKRAYWAVRHMLDLALNEFRDQTLEDFGLPNGTTAATALQRAAQATNTGEAAKLQKVAEVLQGIEDARRTGYVPFTRYGEVGISVRNALTGALIHYETIEPGIVSKRPGKPIAQMKEVKARLDALRAKYPGQTISEPFQVPKQGMPAQVKLEEVDALAEMAKIDNATWDSVRAKLETATAAQGFRAHFFRSHNVPGYSTDFERGLANYVNGIAGYLARRRFAKDWTNAITKISANKPKLFSYAQDYQKYVNSPAEEFGALRSINFVYYLTSPATWLTNLTQVPFVSMPWTTQFANPAKVFAAYTRASAESAAMLTVKNGFQLFSASKAPADVRAAVQEAYDKGLFIPITTYESMGIARNQGRRLRNLSKVSQAAIEILGLGFTMAERQNRIATFIALFRMARDHPEVAQNFARVMAKNALGSSIVSFNQNGSAHVDPAQFAEFGIDDTHFKSGKVNRPAVARNVGTLVFQFKMFNWNMIERLITMTMLQGTSGRAAAALMLGILGVVTGIWGLPGAGNMKDWWEKYQKLMHNLDVNADAETRKIIVDITGSALLAQAVSGGASRALPEPFNIDLSQRVGMGKIIPTDPGDMLGISYDLWVKKPLAAMEQWEVDNYLLAIAEVSPKLAADLMTQLAWSQAGVRSKTSDVPLIPPEKITTGMRIQKAIGFNPGSVANVREAERAEQVAQRAADEVRHDFYRRMSKAMAEEDRAEKAGKPVEAFAAEMRQETIWKEIEDWNKGHDDYLQVRLDRKTARTNLAKEFEGADFDKGVRKQARGEVGRLREVYGR